jgi:glycerophosphoryl diester phosphodiesterase
MTARGSGRAAGRRRPLAVAHRGDSTACPENTPSAFAAALAAGVDGIELDVRLSRDGVPLVCHDPDLARFGGTTRSLRRMSAAEIRQVDIGSWKHPRFADQRVPGLDQVLLQCRSATVLIELKATGGPGRSAYHHQLVRTVVAAIDRRRAARRVMILCFAGEVLAEVARLAPHLRRVRNCERRPADPVAWLAAQPGLHAACFDRRIIDRRLVDTCHARGVRVMAWSANDAGAADRLLDAGVDAILSDRPAWLVRHLGG